MLPCKLLWCKIRKYFATYLYSSISCFLLLFLQALGDSVNARQQLSHAIMALAGHMQAIDQPFNVLMVDCGQRVFVWPQVCLMLLPLAVM